MSVAPPALALEGISKRFGSVAALTDVLNLRPFFNLGLWKSALMEGMGSFMMVWVTIYANSSPNVISVMFPCSSYLYSSLPTRDPAMG